MDRSYRSGGVRVGVVVGTRPEAIKLAPLVLALDGDPRFRTTVISTGQHRDLVGPLLAGFGIRPDIELDLMDWSLRLTDLAGRAVMEIGRAVRELELDVLVVQGDTATATSGALAGFYAGVRVVHVEAGLRTYERRNPFPEEANRRIVTLLADLHLAPTDHAAHNLLAEGVPGTQVVVTGNTVVDALLETVRRDAPYAGPDAEALNGLDESARLLLVTAHRRESWGEGIRSIATAVRRLVERHPDLVAVLPLHPNPLVRDVALDAIAGHPRVLAVAPLPYPDLVRLLRRADLVLTDSGGIQEEACTLGKPTLVARATTERPEGHQAGLRLVGTDAATIVREVETTLTALAGPAGPADLTDLAEAPRAGVLPFGDGRAAERSVAALADLMAPELARLERSA